MPTTSAHVPLRDLLRPDHVAHYKKLVTWALEQKRFITRPVSGETRYFDVALAVYSRYGHFGNDPWSEWIDSVHRLSPLWYKKATFPMASAEDEERVLSKHCNDQIEFYQRLAASLPDASLKNLPSHDELADEYAYYLQQYMEIQQTGDTHVLLIPTLKQDFAWHAHIISPNYLEDVRSAIGVELDHCMDLEDEQRHANVRLVKAKPLGTGDSALLTPAVATCSGAIFVIDGTTAACGSGSSGCGAGCGGA